jgi:hypothetical protein
MATNPFQNIQASPNFDLFKFESEGRTKLRKHIQFDLIDENENIYNLALCTVFPDGTLDCETERYLILLSKDYSIEGLNIVDGEIVNRELIRPGINYHAFLFGKLRK